MMRFFPYLVIVFSLLLFASAGYDEYRGSTRSPSGGKYTNYSHHTITKQAKPEEFHNAMTVHWSYAMLILMAGLIFSMIFEGSEKDNPLCPDSDETIDEELRKDELVEKLKPQEPSPPPKE